MHNLGGQVTRRQVLQELRDNSDVFSEKEIDETRTSKKSGKIYHPFQWIRSNGSLILRLSI